MTIEDAFKYQQEHSDEFTISIVSDAMLYGLYRTICVNSVVTNRKFG